MFDQCSGGVRPPEESNPHWLGIDARRHRFPWRRCALLGDWPRGVGACVGCRRSFCIERQSVVVQLSSLCDLPSDAHSCWPQGAGKGMEWAVSPLNNEASHGLCLSKVELHGFASSGTVLLLLNALIYPPSGDNSRCQSNAAYIGGPKRCMQRRKGDPNRFGRFSSNPCAPFRLTLIASECSGGDSPLYPPLNAIFHSDCGT